MAVTVDIAIMISSSQAKAFKSQWGTTCAHTRQWTRLFIDLNGAGWWMQLESRMRLTVVHCFQTIAIFVSPIGGWVDSILLIPPPTTPLLAVHWVRNAARSNTDDALSNNDIEPFHVYIPGAQSYLFNLNQHPLINKNRTHHAFKVNLSTDSLDCIC